MSLQAMRNEETYLKGLAKLVSKLSLREDRTNTGTQSIFGGEQHYDIRNNHVPLLSTKSVHFHSIVHELIWMLSGSSSIKYLIDNKVRIWNEWLVPGTEVYNDAGDLIDAQTSSIYGESWRRWDDTRLMTYEEIGDIVAVDRESRIQEKYQLLGQFQGKEVVTRKIDQIARIQWQLKHKPFSRAIKLDSWNVARVSDVKLPPCHYTAQFYVDANTESGVPELSCKVTLRSQDAFLGQPFNIVQYSLLTHMLAQSAGMVAGDLFVSFGDFHLYSNHLAAAQEQLARPIILENFPQVTLDFPKGTDITTVKADQIKVAGYKHLGAIKAPIAI